MTTLAWLLLTVSSWAGTPEAVEIATGPMDDAPRQPQVAIDAQGGVFLVFGQKTTIRCTVSTDRGKTFHEPTTVATLPGLALGMRRGPRIAVTGNALVITAIDGGGYRASDGNLLAWRSDDAGQSWSGPTRLNSVAFATREGLHGMAGDAAGRVFVTWLDLRHDRTELWGTASTDGGRTWQPDRLVYRSPDRSICECCHPSAVFGSDGGLHLLWRNSIRGDRDMYLISSFDGGRTFGPARKLGTTSWPLAACPMDGGAVTADLAGRPLTVWRRELTIVATGPDQLERTIGEGTQPWIASGPDGAHVVWMGGTAAHREPRPLLWRSPTAVKPVTLADAVVAPVVAAGPRGPVVAAWEVPGPTSAIRAAVLAP